jgi:endonuclease YncB( thermonuclease family)
MGNMAMLSCVYHYKKYKLDKTDTTIPVFSLNGHSTLCRVIDVYDGDTCTVIFEWDGKMRKFKCRCSGYDSPEMKPRLNIENRADIIVKAKLAKKRLQELTNVCIRIKCLEFDKYGRLLAELYTFYTNEHINQIMIDEGHGYVYNGGTKNNQI